MPVVQHLQQWRRDQIFAFLTKPFEQNLNTDHHNPDLPHSLVAWLWRTAAIIASSKPVF